MSPETPTLIKNCLSDFFFTFDFFCVAWNTYQKLLVKVPLPNIMHHSHLSESDWCVLVHDIIPLRKQRCIRTHLVKISSDAMCEFFLSNFPEFFYLAFSGNFMSWAGGFRTRRKVHPNSFCPQLTVTKQQSVAPSLFGPFVFLASFCVPLQRYCQ